MIGRRSLLSLSQLFELIPYEDVRIICEKHRIEIPDLGFQSGLFQRGFSCQRLRLQTGHDWSPSSTKSSVQRATRERDQPIDIALTNDSLICARASSSMVTPFAKRVSTRQTQQLKMSGYR